jgi:hypothetical protein
MIRYTAGTGIPPKPQRREARRPAPLIPPPPETIPDDGLDEDYSPPPPPTETAADVGSQCPSGSPPTSSDAATTNAIITSPARTSKQEKAPYPPLPPWVSGAILNETEPVLPEELVSGVLHKGAKMVIGGGSKTGKTWLLIDLALSVSSGTPWLGLNCRPGIVVYLNFEIQAGFFHDRLLQVADAKNVELTENLLAWNLRGFARPAAELFAEVQERVAGRDIALFVIDPVYKLNLGGDENSAGETGELLNKFEVLASNTGAAVAFSAHFAKGDAWEKSSVDRISGSGVFARDPDAILTLTGVPKDEGAFIVESTLRNCRALHPFAVRWAFPLLVPEAMKPIVATSKKRVLTEKDFLDALPALDIENPMKGMVCMAELEDALKEAKAPKAGAADMRNKLEKAERIYVIENYGKQKATMVGRVEVRELLTLKEAKEKECPGEGKDVIP